MIDLVEIRIRLDNEEYCTEDVEYLYSELVNARLRLESLGHSIRQMADVLDTDMSPELAFELLENNILQFPTRRMLFEAHN